MNSIIGLKFIPRGLPHDKAMGDCQGEELRFSPLGKPEVLSSGAIKKLIKQELDCISGGISFSTINDFCNRHKVLVVCSFMGCCLIYEFFVKKYLFFGVTKTGGQNKKMNVKTPCYCYYAEEYGGKVEFTVAENCKKTCCAKRGVTDWKTSGDIGFCPGK